MNNWGSRLENIRKSKVVIITGHNPSLQKMEKMFNSLNIKDYKFCNNCGKINGRKISLLSDVIDKINKNNTEKYTIIITINSVYHYQILSQLDEKIECFKNISLLYFSDLEYLWVNVMKSKDTVIDYNVNYCTAIESWTDSLMSEVLFWKEEVLTEGKRCFDEGLEKNNKKYFECERIKILEGSRILDIGCSLLYKWGNVCQKGEYIPIDPLAYYYNFLYKNWKYANSYRKDTVFGMFEFISRYVREKVDYILIDNALDHCIDPLKSILECLKVLKIGGVISLYSYEDESVNAKEHGLHKWNLAVNDDNELIIWNIENFVNINKYIANYCQIDLIEDNRWFHEEVGAHRTFVFNITKLDELPQSFYPDDGIELAFVINAMMKTFSSLEYHKDYSKIL